MNPTKEERKQKVLEKYYEAIAPAVKARDEATALAEKVYVEAKASAWKVYAEAIADKIKKGEHNGK